MNEIGSESDALSWDSASSSERRSNLARKQSNTRTAAARARTKRPRNKCAKAPTKRKATAGEVDVYLGWSAKDPPATIDINTGRPEAPQHWDKREIARNAATGRCQGRLVGTLPIAYSSQPQRQSRLVEAKMVEVEVVDLTRPKRVEYKYYNSSGEYSSPAGQIALEDDSQLALLWSLFALQSPRSSPWRKPLIRCFSTVTESLPTEVPGADVGKQKKLAKSKSSVKRYIVTYFIYLSPLVMELVADQDIQQVMDKVQPVTKVCRTDRLSSQPVTYTTSSGECDPFSLSGLMKVAESRGYAYHGEQPEGLELKLYDYQRSTLQWMLDQEYHPGGLNAFFWEKWQWSDAQDDEDVFFYFPLAGELRIHKPPVRRGGMLCEEMGLGKSAEIVALILSHPSPLTKGLSSRKYQKGNLELDVATCEGPEPANESSEQGGMALVKRSAKEEQSHQQEASLMASGATLVVVPSTLLGQWTAETQKVLRKGAATWLVFEPRQFKIPREKLRMVEDPSKASEALKMNDVVLAPMPWGEEAETEEGESLEGRQDMPYQRARVCGGVQGDLIRLEGVFDNMADHTVVLTTYEALRCPGTLLRSIAWHRVVLDECQEVRVSTSQIAKLCQGLHADFRWMVSGTPLFTSIGDLQGELDFLQVYPFSIYKDGFWELRIDKPWQNREQTALVLLHALIKTTMIRHSKAQSYLDGRPILNLPPCTIVWQPIAHMSASERFLSAYLEIIATREIKRSRREDEGDIVTDPGRPRRIGRGRFAGRTSKLRALLYFCQRALIHPSLIPLEQLDSIKRSLQIAQAIDARSGSKDGIPRLRVGIILSRLASVGVSRQGGLNRDVGRTWALGGEEEEGARAKMELLRLEDLRAMCTDAELTLPITWLRLPLRASVVQGSVIVEVQPEKLDGREAAERPRGKESVAMTKANRGCKRKSTAEAAEAVEGGPQALREIPEKGESERKNVGEMLMAGDVIRVRQNDKDLEAVVKMVVEEGYGGQITIEQPWTDESLAEVKIYKKAVSTRKRAYVDILIARRQQLKGATSDIHEAGFQGIYRLVQGEGINCSICLCGIQEPTITYCGHAFCLSCILAQLEEAKRQLAQNYLQTNVEPRTKCAICRKNVTRAQLMQVDVDSIEEYAAAGTEGEGCEATAAGGAGTDLHRDLLPSGPLDSNSKLALGEALDVLPWSPGPLNPPPEDANLGFTLPELYYPPAATAEDLRRIAEPPRQERNPRLPSLEPGFLAHIRLCHQVISSKVRILLRDMESTLDRDPSSKFVIFSQFPSAISLLSEVLTDREIQHGIISSQSDRLQRQRVVAHFTKSVKIKLILVTVGTGAAGLTLIAANTLYMLEPCYNLADEAQALARICRAGQLRPCRCVILYNQGTVEERLLYHRARDQKLVQKLIDNSALAVARGGEIEEAKEGSFTLHQLQTLFGLDPCGDSMAGNAGGRDWGSGRRTGAYGVEDVST